MFGSGKYYWEIKRIEDDGNDLHAGVMSEDATPLNTATWMKCSLMVGLLQEIQDNLIQVEQVVLLYLILLLQIQEIFICVPMTLVQENYILVQMVLGVAQANPSTGANPHYTLDTSKVYFPCVSTGSDW